MKNSENIHRINVFAGTKVWQARKFKTIQKYGVSLLPTRWRLCQLLAKREIKSRIKKKKKKCFWFMNCRELDFWESEWFQDILCLHLTHDIIPKRRRDTQNVPMEDDADTISSAETQNSYKTLWNSKDVRQKKN